MKNLLYFLSSALLVLTFTNCNNDDDGPSQDGTMSAEIDGQSWEAEEVAATYLQSRLVVAGRTPDGQDVVISLDMPQLEENAFELSEETLSAIAYNESANSNSFTSNGNVFNNEVEITGQVTVTEINTDDMWVSGTFNATCYRPLSVNTPDSVVITNGQFTKVPYTDEVPTTDGDNSLTVNIDGQTWQANSVAGTLISTSGLNTLSVTATDSQGEKSVGLVMPPDVTTGTYSLAVFGDYTAQYNPDANTFLGADSGTLTITEHNTTAKIVKGTFSFEATSLSGTGAASLTDGEFSATY